MIILFDPRLYKADKTARYLLDKDATTMNKAIPLDRDEYSDIDVLRQSYNFFETTMDYRYWVDEEKYKKFNKEFKFMVVSLGLLIIAFVTFFYISVMQLIS